jgi:hypothetical protein
VQIYPCLHPGFTGSCLVCRRQLQEARTREFEVLPLLVTPNTRHAPGFVPRGSVLSSCPPALRCFLTLSCSAPAALVPSDGTGNDGTV